MKFQNERPILKQERCQFCCLIDFLLCVVFDYRYPSFHLIKWAYLLLWKSLFLTQVDLRSSSMFQLLFLVHNAIHMGMHYPFFVILIGVSEFFFYWNIWNIASDLCGFCVSITPISFISFSAHWISTSKKLFLKFLSALVILHRWRIPLPLNIKLKKTMRMIKEIRTSTVFAHFLCKIILVF